MTLEELLQQGALGIHSLTGYINNLPDVPTRIGDLGLFEESGIDSTIALIGVDDQKLVLVPAVPRGAPAQPKALAPKGARAFQVPHLPQRSTVMADSVQGARVFGENGHGDQLEAVTGKVNALQKVHRRDNDYTIEYHRLGALSGLVLDADGSVLFDLYNEFGVTQQSFALVLGTATTNVKAKIKAATREIQLKLGGIRPRGYRAFAGPAFMDALTGHDKVLKAYDRYMDGAALREDVNDNFAFGGVVFEEYQGALGNTTIIADNEAILVPMGVPGMFITRFAPADYIETVNTTGLPYYTKTEVAPFGKGIDVESQSNPLSINTRPAAVVKLTL